MKITVTYEEYQTVTNKITVEADNEQEALEKVKSGEFDTDEVIEIDVRDDVNERNPTEWEIVEETNEEVE